LIGSGTTTANHFFCKNETEIFFANGLDNPNHLESKGRNRFLAHAISKRFCVAGARPDSETELICPTGGDHRILSSLARKNISVFRKAESVVSFAHPASLAEGRIAVVTKREAECGGRADADRRTALAADGEVVWSWHPLAGAKFRGMAREATVTKKSWTPGRARSSR